MEPTATYVFYLTIFAFAFALAALAYLIFTYLVLTFMVSRICFQSQSDYTGMKAIARSTARARDNVIARVNVKGHNGQDPLEKAGEMV